MRKVKRQRNFVNDRYHSIVLNYAEGLSSTEIIKKFNLKTDTYWRTLRDGGGMPSWAKIEHLENRRMQKINKGGRL